MDLSGVELGGMLCWACPRAAPLFGAYGAAWNERTVVPWSSNPLGMLWPEMDAALVTSGDIRRRSAGCGAAGGGDDSCWLELNRAK